MRDKGPWRGQVPHPTCSSLANSTTRIGAMTHRRRHGSDNTPLRKREIGVIAVVVCVVWAVNHSTAERLSSRKVTGDSRRYSFMQVTTRSSYYKERWELLWAARVLKRTYSDGLNSIDRNIHSFPDREPCPLPIRILAFDWRLAVRCGSRNQDQWKH